MNYSYVTLLTSDDFIYGVMVLNETLKRVQSKYPLYAVVTSNVSLPVLEILNQLNISFKIVTPIVPPTYIQEYNISINKNTTERWYYNFTKIEIFDLIQFDKIIYLDADVMILKNIDHLFEYPHITGILDNFYFSPNNFCSGGFFIYSPSHLDYTNLLKELRNLNIKSYNNQFPYTLKWGITEMELINYYFHDMLSKNLITNKYYNIYTTLIQDKDLATIQKNGYFLHFINTKPWQLALLKKHFQCSQYYYEQYMRILKQINSSLNWYKIRQRVIISVYAICKNEIKSINKYITSFSKADYLCILDTGSTDGTWEVLQEKQKIYPNLIIKQKIIQPWRFDQARNESFNLVPSNTTLYFMADIDEYIEEGNWNQIIKDYWAPHLTRGQFTYHRTVNENNVPQHSYYENRIHNNSWNHYEYRVHEQLFHYSGRRNFYLYEIIRFPIHVIHQASPNSRQQYLRLCQNELQEHPNNSIMRLQLALEYYYNHAYEASLEEFQTLIANYSNDLSNIENSACYYYIGLLQQYFNNEEESIASFKKGAYLYPNVCDNFYSLAVYYFNNELYQNVIIFCNYIKTYCYQYGWCSSYSSDSYLIDLLLGLSYYKLNILDEAKKYLNQAYEKQPLEQIKQFIISIS